MINILFSYQIIRDHFINNYKILRTNLNKSLTAHPRIKQIKTYVYSLSINVNYKNIIKTLDNLFISYGGKIEDTLVKTQLDKKIAVSLELQTALDDNKEITLSEKDKSEIKDEIKKNINQKKYERKSPNEKAKNFDLGHIAASENDKKKYIVYEDKNNVKKWKQYKEL